ncbi:tryptophan--tRNA ligase [Oscillospiraceae bacterium MB08-C2-2]|nr:tryptophan--tRNA ligase [Oscillospiraceae bacterium MB08-C2-2]
MEQSPSVKKPVIFSGIQPTGVMTLGNYMGAIKNWVALQEDYRCIYSVVDMHSITIRQDPKVLRENVLRAYALLMACGIDPQKSILFVQSHVSAHAELNWVLGCFTPYGELGRMTQFKDKSASHPENINAGLFTYPVLQAADILLYQADLVPVGADQKQHLELSRNIAERFNGIYGNTFTVPEPYIPKEGSKIMSLANPTQKMSKSDANPKAFVSILDEPGTIVKKFRSAVTDSDTQVMYGEGKDGINNLMTIYSLVTGKTMEQIALDFEGKGYGDFKTAVGEAVAEHLRPIQERFKELSADKGYITQCYKESALAACSVANRTIEKVYKKIGFTSSGL